MTAGHAGRAHALLSASSSERWSKCPASARLASRYPREDTPYTLEGTAAHEVAELMASRIALGIDTPDLPGEQYTSEMYEHGKAYGEYIAELTQPGSSVLLEQRVSFAQYVPEGFGTADCIVIHPDKTMDVIDYKYGSGVAVSAVCNTQMQLYALGALYEYGFVYDVESVRLHIFQPRKDSISVWEISVPDLEKFGGWISGKAEAAMSDTAEVHAGDHCRFCPHAGKCTGLALYCIAGTTDGAEPAEMLPDPMSLSPRAVSYILGHEAMISSWLKKVKESALCDLLNGEEIPGYKVVEGKLGNRAWTDETAVAAALDAAGLAPELYTETVLKSPAAMDKALGKKRAAELLKDLISRSPGAPTVVPETDKRPKLDRAAQAKDDFAD